MSACPSTATPVMVLPAAYWLMRGLQFSGHMAVVPATLSARLLGGPQESKGPTYTTSSAISTSTIHLLRFHKRKLSCCMSMVPLAAALQRCTGGRFTVHRGRGYGASQFLCHSCCGVWREAGAQLDWRLQLAQLVHSAAISACPLTAHQWSSWRPPCRGALGVRFSVHRGMAPAIPQAAAAAVPEGEQEPSLRHSRGDTTDTILTRARLRRGSHLLRVRALLYITPDKCSSSSSSLGQVISSGHDKQSAGLHLHARLYAAAAFRSGSCPPPPPPPPPSQQLLS